jgi:hypothetical protein
MFLVRHLKEEHLTDEYFAIVKLKLLISLRMIQLLYSELFGFDYL